MLWCRSSVPAVCVTAIERGKRGTRKKSRLCVLQEFIDRLFDGREDYMRLEVVLEGEAYGLNGELMEVLNLLPPGLYTRDRLCGQINSSLSSHGWGYVYGAVH